MTLRKEILSSCIGALLIMAFLLLAFYGFSQVGAQGAREHIPISEYLVHDMFDVDGMPCVIVYMPKHIAIQDSDYPMVSGVSCDWDPPRR